MRTPDETLIIASRSGDSTAFGEIVRRYQNYVASIAYSATGSFDQSEEIAQQAFVVAWQRQQNLNDPKSLVAWLGGITRNLIRSNFKQQIRRKVTHDLPVVQDDSPDPLQRCINREQQEMLWSVLEKLPEHYREPLILFHRNDRSVAEVARLLEISPDAVKQRLSRGRKLIREELSSFVEESLAQSGPSHQFSAAVLALVAGKSKAVMATGTAASTAAPIAGATSKSGTSAMTITGVVAGTVTIVATLVCATFALGMTWYYMGQAEETRVTPHRFKLANGMKVVLRPVEGTQDAALVTVFEVGELHDPAGKSGLSHLVEHLYVSAATDKTPARNVQQYIAAYPKGWNAQTGGDSTVIATVFEAEKLKSEIQDAAARMGALDIQQTDLDREIPRMIQEVNNMFRNFAPLVATNLARENLSPRPHSGRKGGHPDQIKKLTLVDARNHWKSFHKPANATLVLAGKFDAENAERLIRKAFEELDPGEQPTTTAAKPSVYKPAEFDVANSQDVIVCMAMGYPTPDSDLFPAAVAIATELTRQGRKITTDFQKAPVLFMPLDDFGVIYLRAWADKQQDDSVQAADQAQAKLDAMISKLDPAEVVKTARLVKTQMATLFDTVPIADAMLKRNLYGVAFGIARREQLGIDGPKLAQQLDNLTQAQVTRCLEKYFAKDKRAMAIVK